MEKIIKEGKNEQEVIENILSENNLNIEDIITSVNVKKGGLFKGNIVEVTAYKKSDINNEIKKYLTEIVTGMGLEVSFEIRKKEDREIIKMYSNDNSILIGKNGQTIKSLESLTRQMLNATYNINYRVTLDVENYKDKKESHLIRLAKNSAKEVLKTKGEIHLENMTSYERRIVHNALTNFKDISTESTGEEPHRHIVIKIKK